MVENYVCIVSRPAERQNFKFELVVSGVLGASSSQSVNDCGCFEFR